MSKKYRFASRSAAERTSGSLGRYFVVVSPVDRSTHRLSEEEFALAGLFDGTRSVESVLQVARNEKNMTLSEAQLAEFIEALRGRKLLEEAAWDIADIEAEAPQQIAPGKSPAAKLPAAYAAAQGDGAAQTGSADAELGDDVVKGMDRASTQPSGGLLVRIPISWLLPPLRLITRLLSSRVFVIGLVGLMLVCLFGIFHHEADFRRDMIRLLRPSSFLVSLIPAALFVDFLAQLIRAGAISRHSTLAPPFGIALMFNVIPNFRTDMSALKLLSLTNRRNVIATSLNGKLLIFVLSIAGWLVTRDNPSTMPLLYVAVSISSAFALLRSTNVLAKREGYFLLATKLQMPELYERAMTAIIGRHATTLLTGHHSSSPIMRAAARPVPRWALVIYALTVTAYFCAVVLLLFTFIGTPLAASWGGLGIVLFVALLGTLVWPTLVRAVRSLFGGEAQPPAQAVVSAKPVPARQKVGQVTWLGIPIKKNGKPPISFMSLLIWAIVIGILFLPYSYETSGNFELLAQARQNINAPTSGEIVSVNFRGGEVVPKGTVIANVDSQNQKNRVEVSRELVSRQEALIEEKNKTSEMKEARLVRVDQLFKQGYETAQAYDEARTNAATAREEITQAKANLAKIREQLRFDMLELERTILRMPIDGQIITTELDKKVTQYLKEGELFAVVEHTDSFQARVEVPEADAGTIKIGNEVSLKAWAYPTRIFTGKIRSIDPVVVQMPYGRVINTYVEVYGTPKEGLKSGMTGIAKVEAENTIVAVAFTRMLVRFFLIELWSWIP